MRITRGQLTDLINEEISNALLERQNRRLLEDAGASSSIPMDSLIRFAKQYVRISPDDRNNLDLLVSGRGESVTPDEIQDLQYVFKGFSEELDQFFEEALESSVMYSDEDEDEDDGTWAAAVRMNR